jgi:branched-chain amino acid transport system ATP-binding protein
MSDGTTLLSIEGMSAGYDDAAVVRNLDVTVGSGEVVALLGPNGAGKTTTLRTISGLVHPMQGRILYDGGDLARLSSSARAREGIAHVPEGRGIFFGLTVAEHFRLGHRGETLDPDIAYGYFPALAELKDRRSGLLSGGEQQMLAVGRALMTNPRLLILDEATEGLAPLIRAEIWRCLEGLKAEGLSILLIDKNIGALTRHGDRHHIVEKGRVVWSGGSAALRADLDAQHRYLGV